MIKEQKGTVWNVKKYDKITRFTLSIAHKNKQTNEWESGYLGCVIMNDKYSHELYDKMKIEVDGNLTPNQWQDKEGKIHHDIQLWVDDLRYSESKPIAKGNEDTEDILPFI